MARPTPAPASPWPSPASPPPAAWAKSPPANIATLSPFGMRRVSRSDAAAASMQAENNVAQSVIARSVSPLLRRRVVDVVGGVVEHVADRLAEEEQRPDERDRDDGGDEPVLDRVGGFFVVPEALDERHVGVSLSLRSVVGGSMCNPFANANCSE